MQFVLPAEWDDEIAERIKPLSKSYSNAPQAKGTLRLESTHERRFESDHSAPLNPAETN